MSSTTLNGYNNKLTTENQRQPIILCFLRADGKTNCSIFYFPYFFFFILFDTTRPNIILKLKKKRVK